MSPMSCDLASLDAVSAGCIAVMPRAFGLIESHGPGTFNFNHSYDNYKYARCLGTTLLDVINFCDNADLSTNYRYTHKDRVDSFYSKGYTDIQFTDFCNMISAEG
jgi:hypothetical protein